METGVLINPDEEKLLDDPAYRAKIADCILAAFQEYCAAQELHGPHPAVDPRASRNADFRPTCIRKQ